MALSPRIEIRQSQSLVMTPQLQQAIKLLQMSNLELADYLGAEVEKNPLLELAPPSSPAPGGRAPRRGRRSFLDAIAAEVTPLRPPARADRRDAGEARRRSRRR